MKGCVIAILFIVLLFFGTAGWICATVAGIILLASMGGKTKRAMLSERSEVGSRDVSVSYGAMS